MAEILTSDKFKKRMTESAKAALEKAGGKVVDEGVDDLSDLELEEPAYGEKIIGTLTPDEIWLFRVFYVLTDRLEELNCAIGGEALTQLGAAIKDRKNIKEAHSVLESHMEESSAPVIEMFTIERQLDTFKSQLYLSICERLGHWDYKLGIRSKGRIVSLERKW